MKIIRTLAAAAGIAALSLLNVLPAHALFSEPLPMGEWTNVTAPAPAQGAGATFKLQETADGLMAVGTTGCNYYNAPVTRAGEVQIHLGDFTMTRMACDFPHAAAEAAFVNAFENQTVAYDVTSQHLSLGANGEWGFDRVGTAPVPAGLRGTWTLVPYETTVAGVGYQSAKLTINQDATFRGTTACNQVLGNVLADGGVVHFTDVSTTRMLCDNASMAKEQAYVGALSAAHTWTVSATRLTVYVAGGKLVYRPSLY